MLIYKIFHPSEWNTLKSQGKTLGAPIDIQDGYVHFSTAQQVKETAAKHFAHEADLILLGLDSDALGDALKWEESRGGALFPHLYRALKIEDVLWDAPLPLLDGIHQFPEDLT